MKPLPYPTLEVSVAEKLSNDLVSEKKTSDDLKDRIAKLEEQNKFLLAENMALVGKGESEMDYELDGMIRHRVDLPASGGSAIVINGVEFFHGQEYPFERATYAAILEIESRAWAHEREIKGGASFDNA